MNLTQVLLVLVPAVLLYGYFVFTAKSQERIHYGTNLVVGLLFVPLILLFLPAILLSLHANGWRKRRWGEVLVPLLILVVLASYGALVWHLRDPTMPTPYDLPVER